MPEVEESNANRVVELLNSAAFQTSEKERVQTLSQVQELVIHFDSTILDSFFEDVVSYQTDRNSEVRKFVVGFIEEACKKDNAMLPRLVPNVEILLADEAVSVVKRVIQAAAQLYRFTLTWISSARQQSSEMQQTWEIITRIKNNITPMIDHDNDGVRTQAIKFIESLIMIQTYTETDSVQRIGELNLDQIPLTLKIARPRKLEEEAKNVLSKLITFQGSLHISSVNLMTCMSSLSIIARGRPQFMGKVIEALEILHANLPPTLTKSQVNSVRKHLKIQLINLLRHTASFDYHENILAILNDLGASSSDISKAMPSKEDIRKRVKRTKSGEEHSSESPKKRSRTEKKSKRVADGKEPPRREEPSHEKNTAVDITTRWLVDKLNIEGVTNLVMVTMLNLPEKIPALFSVSYTPVTAAGSSQQVQYVGRLLASQLTAAGLGPGAEKVDEEEKAKQDTAQDSDEENVAPDARPSKIQRIFGRHVEKDMEIFDRPSLLLPAGIAGRPLWQKAKFVKLSEVTKELSTRRNLDLQMVLFKRILECNKLRLYGTAQNNRLRILGMFATSASMDELFEMEEFIFCDLAGNLDLLHLWLFTQYAASHDFSQMSTIITKGVQDLPSYEKLILQIVKRIMALSANKERDEILSDLLLEAPSIPQSVIDHFMENGTLEVETIQCTISLLKDLVEWRPMISSACLRVLCILATHNQHLIRDKAGRAVLHLYELETFEKEIVEAAKVQLDLLSKPTPSDDLYKVYLARPFLPPEWNEESVKASLYLPLLLLPLQQDIIHNLADVYVNTVNEAKRTILRLLERPVAHMGMDSPALLALVEECPKGSETLITRIIHILTEKAPPSPELVGHVRELYNKRVSDVRFLIPVLTGLSKKEVIAVLPKLIKLNPHVVKEVFNRLWGVTLDVGTSSLSPVELLVALHLISTEKYDVKTIIKATGLCFAERTIYTPEALAIVLQQLLEQPTLPTLFMRTVIQTLTHHPKLLSFIMNILQRLITKQIWNDRKAWEGFIKCCQRSMPQSFNVLLQLPPQQLGGLLVQAPDLKEEVTAHIDSLTENQRAHIPSSILEVIQMPKIKLEKEDNYPDDLKEDSIIFD